jgi:hypothetical protein
MLALLGCTFVSDADFEKRLEAQDLDDDGVSVSEGDCDDGDPAVNPNATEDCATAADDDCDGAADGADALGCTPYFQDADGDGFGSDPTGTCLCQPTEVLTVTVSDDCDDTDAAVHPEATELCNDGVDDDCDDLTDEEGAEGCIRFAADRDGDGWGDLGDTRCLCAVDGYYTVEDGAEGDCDDQEASANPGVAGEDCATEFDDDCDGETNSEDAASCTDFYRDDDGDGYGAESDPRCLCEGADNYTAGNGDDCDDGAGSVNPDEVENCETEDDDDCDGVYNQDDARGCDDWYLDADGDGWTDGTSRCLCESDGAYTVSDGALLDCDDTNSAVSPSVTLEDCDTTDDDDCDGEANELDAANCDPWYADGDGDGYGGGESTCWCDASGAYTYDASTDCDDADAAISPAAAEVTGDEVDGDCDGTEVCYADADGDGHADSGGATITSADATCDGPGEASDAAAQDDCDDADAATYPGAGEVCGDGADNDCDGVTDVNCRLSGTYGISSVAYATFIGEDPNDEAGYALAGVPDVTGDGVDDLLIGAPYAEISQTDGGITYLVSGGTAGTNDLSTATASFYGDMNELSTITTGIAGLGDLDADGVGDFIIGGYRDSDAALEAGSAYVFLGGSLSGQIALDDADWVLHGETSYDWAGISVALAGDVSGDGAPDFAIGAPYRDDSGSGSGTTYLYFSTPSSTSLANADAELQGDATSASSGLNVESAGDVNGDGTADLLIAGPYDDRGGTDAGRVWIVHGPISSGTASLSTADTTLTGSTSADYLGSSIAGAGDTDGDGLDDVLVGADEYDGGASNGGGACLFLGAVTGIANGGFSSADACLLGDDAQDYVGYRVTGAGDLDLDGYADLALPAPNDDLVPSSAGTLALMYGPVTGTTLVADADARISGNASGDFLGTAVTGAFDYDGDGIPDLAVGSYGMDNGGSLAGGAYVILGE